MDKEHAIEKLISINNELNLMPKFNGKSQILKKIEKSIQFLIKFKVLDNIPMLIVSELERDLSNVNKSLTRGIL